ncbi:MAG TPA: ABC transporter substrate-binding protein [Negativicutes bacterium]
MSRKINYKKKFSLLAALVLLVGLVSGCSSTASKDVQPDNVIKIGGVYELTGNTASFGTSAANGAKMAFKEMNTKGGILGKQVQFIVADNKSEPAESANAMSKVISQDKVVAVTGFTVSSNGIAAAAVAEASKIPFVAAATVSSDVTVDKASGKVKDYVFRVCFVNPFQGMVGANFALNTLKAKKAAIMIDNSSDYSKGLTQVFKEEFIKGGGTIVVEEAYLQKDQDFKTILTKLKALNPDMIFLPGYYEEVGKIIKQARELGMNMPFVGGDGWDSPKLVEIGGAQALNNSYFVNHYSVEDTSLASKTFVEAYKKEYGQIPDAMAVLAYDAAYVLADAITRANSTEPDKIRAALAATKNFKGVTGEISMNESHDAVKSAIMLELKDGKQVYKETIKP